MSTKEQAKNEHGLTAAQEVFAQMVASSRTQADAYRAAYPSSLKWETKTLYSRASELMADGKVAGRVAVLRAEITQRAIEEAAVDRAFVLNGLKTIARRCLQAAPVLNKKGEPVMVEVEGPEGEKTIVPAFTFEPAGANRAYELLGKEIGMFVDRKESGKPGEFADLKQRSTAEIEAEAREILAAGVKLGVVKVLPRKQAKAA